MDMNMMTIGARIKTRREQLNMTQTDFGESIGLSKHTVSRYESGDIKNLGVDLAKKMARVLRCDPLWLMDWGEIDYEVENEAIDAIIKALHKEPLLLTIFAQCSRLPRARLEKIIKMLDVMIDC